MFDVGNTILYSMDVQANNLAITTEHGETFESHPFSSCPSYNRREIRDTFEECNAAFVQYSPKAGMRGLAGSSEKATSSENIHCQIVSSSLFSGFSLLLLSDAKYIF